MCNHSENMLNTRFCYTFEWFDVTAILFVGRKRCAGTTGFSICGRGMKDLCIVEITCDRFTVCWYMKCFGLAECQFPFFPLPPPPFTLLRAGKPPSRSRSERTPQDELSRGYLPYVSSRSHYFLIHRFVISFPHSCPRQSVSVCRCGRAVSSYGRRRILCVPSKIGREVRAATVLLRFQHATH